MDEAAEPAFGGASRLGLHVLISGEIGVGKSTVLRRTMALLGITRPRGFYVEGQGKRPNVTSLELCEWGGERRVFATRTQRPRAGLPYEVNFSTFDEFGAELLQRRQDAVWTVVDELGVMEQSASLFVAAVARALKGPGATLMVVQARALDFWLERIGGKNVDHLVWVDEANREDVPGRISALYRLEPDTRAVKPARKGAVVLIQAKNGDGGGVEKG